MVSFDCQSLNISSVLTAKRELVFLFELVYNELVAIQGIPALLKNDRAEIHRFLELRRTLCQMVEEPHVCNIKTLYYLLYALRV